MPYTFSPSIFNRSRFTSTPDGHTRLHCCPIMWKFGFVITILLSASVLVKNSSKSPYDFFS